jgi:hypothetical protein
MTITLTTPPAAQWRLLNLLNANKSRGNAAAYGAAAACGLDDLYKLEDDGLVTATIREAPIAMKLAAPLLTSVTLLLTDRGRVWVRGNAYNAVLWHLDARPHGRAPISFVAYTTGADLDIFAALVRAQLVRVTIADQTVELTGAMLHDQSRTVQMQLTNRGRGIVRGTV